jgi:hypothetical protein
MESKDEESLHDHILQFGILDYLPYLGFSTPDQVTFLQYLIDTFNNNWGRRGKSELHQIAFKAYYDLYITFVFVKVWQIKEHMNSKFMTYFDNIDASTKNKLADYVISSNNGVSSNIFTISVISEKQVFDFFRVFGFHSNIIDQFSSYVTYRNHCSHPCGFVQYTASNLSNYMAAMISDCDEIVVKSMPFIEAVFGQFLIDNYDLNDDPDIFDNGFIKPKLLSLKEIGYLCKYDIESLNTHPDYAQIESFFHNYKNRYAGII